MGDTEDDSEDDKFMSLLEDAKNIYLDLVYPYHHDILELPNTRARNWQVRCAIELYYLGDDSSNVISYSENGLSEKYEKAGLSKDLLNALPPAHGGVPIDG